MHYAGAEILYKHNALLELRSLALREHVRWDPFGAAEFLHFTGFSDSIIYFAMPIFEYTDLSVSDAIPRAFSAPGLRIVSNVSSSNCFTRS